MRILIVDDHEVVRIGLKALLERRPGFQVVGEAGTAAEAVELARSLDPDVVVMDVRLPDESGIEACRKIRQSGLHSQVIILTSYTEDDQLFDAIQSGAAGYVLKQIGSNSLVSSIEAVGRGESALDPVTAQKVLTRLKENTREADTVFHVLTEQELKIMALVAEGMTNREIADRVFLSEKTVRNYVSSILRKLNLATRSQIAAFAVKHRIKERLVS